MRGYSAIACVGLKCPPNFGSVLRAAHCYDAKLVILDAPRFHNAASNVTQAQRHIPLVVGRIEDVRPYDCEMVVVELVAGAKSLVDFKHPERALYVFGPEDGSVPNRLVSTAQHIVQIPTSWCMNLAATANVVLYDRLAKQSRRDTGAIRT
jgi:tRNA(Leu) C34 or U34 (ribose-2'-O)-methylase TrmL